MQDEAEELFSIVDSLENTIMESFFENHMEVPLNYVMVACQRLAARIASDMGVPPTTFVKTSQQMILKVDDEKKAKNLDVQF